MKLLIAILRQNISIPQIVSFVLANLVGGFIVLLGIQAYLDVDKFMESGDTFLRGEPLVISKPVTGLSTVTTALGLDPGFSPSEIADIARLPQVEGVGAFTAARCRVRGQITLGEVNMATDMFLESVPDEYIDVTVGNDNAAWSATYESEQVPLIIPRTYLNLYNYGFAATRGLPQMGEGMMSAFPFRLSLSGNGLSRTYSARIVGFSDRLNTILVPQDFMDSINAVFANDRQKKPSRLIVSTVLGSEPTELLSHLDAHSYVIEGSPEAVKIQTLVHGALSAVIFVGLLVSALAFYQLVVSIYLLIEKNREKLSVLSALGYPTRQIAWPYQQIIGVADVAVWLLAAMLVWCVYPRVSHLLETLSGTFVPASRGMIFATALPLMLLFVILHFAIIRRQIAMSKCRTCSKTC